METGAQLCPPVDPKTPLSNLDLAKFLIEDTQKQIAVLKDHLIDCMNDDRKHFNEVINLVVNGNNQKVDKLVDCIIQTKDEFSNKVTDLELFVKTVSSYNEHIINTINHRIHDLCISVESLKETETSVIRASSRIQEFHTQELYSEH